MAEKNKKSNGISSRSNKTKVCATVKTENKTTENKTKVCNTVKPSENAKKHEIEEVPVVKKEKMPAPKRRYGTSAVSAFIKTFVYIAVVLVVSVILALNIIWIANDVFAFSKTDVNVNVSVGEFPDVDAIAKALAEKDVIKYPSVFKLYAQLKKKDNYNFAEGTYTVNPSMNYDDLLIAFVPGKAEREQVRITIPEGSSVDEIIDYFLAKGIGTRDGFIDAINLYDYDYWFLEDLECSEDRIYRLEGYLYPDTYYFWSDSSEVTAINKLLANFEKKVKKKWLTRCEELGLTLDQVLTMASMVEEEAFYPSDYTTVASVFHNRLKSDEFKGLMQSDATTQYFYRHVYGEKRAPFTDNDRKFNCPYSTYTNNGLPPSAISSPTVEAIGCVLYPAETNYYYFITDGDGRCMFAVTYEEHKRNIAAVEEEKSAGDNEQPEGGEG